MGALTTLQRRKGWTVAALVMLALGLGLSGVSCPENEGKKESGQAATKNGPKPTGVIREETYIVRGLTPTTLVVKKGMVLMIRPDYSVVTENGVEWKLPTLFDATAPQPLAPQGALVFGFADGRPPVDLFSAWKGNDFLVSAELDGLTLFLSNNNGDRNVRATVSIRMSDAPAPVSPRNTVVRTALPSFVWDPNEDAVRYVFQMDTTNKFSSQPFAASNSVFVGSEEGPFALPFLPQGEVARVIVGEGIFFWRVQAQTNLGRPLNPDTHYTEASPGTPFSVELGLSPIVIVPEIETIETGVTQRIRFLSPRDATGNLARVSVLTRECNDTNAVLREGEWHFMPEEEPFLPGEMGQAMEIYELAVSEKPQKYSITIEVTDGFTVLIRDLAGVRVSLDGIKPFLPPALADLNLTVKLEDLLGLRTATAVIVEDTCSGTTGDPSLQILNPELSIGEPLSVMETLATGCFMSLSDGTVAMGRALLEPPENIPVKRENFITFKLKSNVAQSSKDVILAFCEAVEAVANTLSALPSGGGGGGLGGGAGGGPGLSCKALSAQSGVSIEQLADVLRVILLLPAQTVLQALINAFDVDFVVNGDIFSPRIKLGNLADYFEIDLTFVPEPAFLLKLDIPIVDLDRLMRERVDKIFGEAETRLSAIFNQCLPLPLARLLQNSWVNTLATAQGSLFQTLGTGGNLSIPGASMPGRPLGRGRKD